MTYRRIPDHLSVRAKKEGFAARSVYKLEEIDRRLKLFRQGQRVLDLGAAPGSWVQYIAPKIGGRGKLVAVDLNPLRVLVPAHVTHHVLDVMAASLDDFAALGPFDVVVSDMAPHTTGIRDADIANSTELVDRAIVIAARVLLPGGTLLAKVFQGDGFVELRARMKQHFREVRILKPEASKRDSIEIYLAGIDKLP